MTFLDWLASTIGIAVILSALTVALWQLILNHITAGVQHKFDEDLVTHKDKLDRATELAIKDVEAWANERSIRLTRMFEKQADIIAETYALLDELYAAYKQFAYNLNRETHQQYREEFNAKMVKFTSYYEPKALYFPDATAETIKQYIVSMRMAQMQFDVARTEATRTEPDISTFRDKYKEFFQMNDTLPDLFKKLRQDFQNLLGVNGPEKQMKTGLIKNP
jgi:hypothetical protein